MFVKNTDVERIELADAATKMARALFTLKTDTLKNLVLIPLCDGRECQNMVR